MNLWNAGSYDLNKINIMTTIITLTIVSGCTGENTGNTVPSTKDPKPAQNAIMQAQLFMHNIHADFAAASAHVDDAKLLQRRKEKNKIKKIIGEKI
jgi:hypothetical protein